MKKLFSLLIATMLFISMSMSAFASSMYYCDNCKTHGVAYRVCSGNQAFMHPDYCTLREQYFDGYLHTGKCSIRQYYYSTLLHCTACGAEYISTSHIHTVTHTAVSVNGVCVEVDYDVCSTFLDMNSNRDLVSRAQGWNSKQLHDLIISGILHP